jgi:hypothetical protein
MLKALKFVSRGSLALRAMAKALPGWKAVKFEQQSLRLLDSGIKLRMPDVIPWDTRSERPIDVVAITLMATTDQESKTKRYRQSVQEYLSEHVAVGAEPTVAQIDAAHAIASETQAMEVANNVAKKLGLSVQRDRDARGEEFVVFASSLNTAEIKKGKLVAP